MTRIEKDKEAKMMIMKVASNGFTWMADLLPYFYQKQNMICAYPKKRFSSEKVACTYISKMIQELKEDKDLVDNNCYPGSWMPTQMGKIIWEV